MFMKEQSFKNHSRYVVGHHFITSGLLLLLLIGAIYNVFHVSTDNLLTALLILLATVIFGFMFWFMRAFALRAQDRAIRAEENFRHYALTGKPFPPGVSMSQVIALRFAHDEELPALAERAVKEKLSSRQIKQAIKSWRADHHRA